MFDGHSRGGCAGPGSPRGRDLRRRGGCGPGAPPCLVQDAHVHAAPVQVDPAVVSVQFDAGRAPFEEYPENTPQQPVRLHIPVRQQPTGGERNEYCRT
jgi:hypothetical protein